HIKKYRGWNFLQIFKCHPWGEYIRTAKNEKFTNLQAPSPGYPQATQSFQVSLLNELTVIFRSANMGLYNQEAG
ncbi:MAG: hypothetical protein AB7V16_13355, partial [Vulcanibacillus sp.]